MEREYLSAAEAAERLGVSPVRVRVLAEQGRIPAQKIANRWVVNASLLANYGPSRAGGRPFSESHALGLLFLASGEDPRWLSPYEIWRLRRYALPRLQQVLPLLRGRAQIQWLRAPESAIKRLRNDRSFVRSGVSALHRYGANLSAPDVLDGYYPRSQLEPLAYRFAMSPVPELSANLVVRGVGDPIVLRGREVMPRAVVAADLADSNNSRTKRAGLQLLGELT